MNTGFKVKTRHQVPNSREIVIHDDCSFDTYDAAIEEAKRRVAEGISVVLINPSGATVFSHKW